MVEQEEWRQIPGFSDYDVSSLGRVRRRTSRGGVKAGKPMYQNQGREGYFRVLFRPLVHVLVAQAFVGPRKEGMFANHKDGNKANNRADNLEWVTPSDNGLHAYGLGLQQRGERHGMAKLTDDQVREIRARYAGEWGGQTALAKEYGVSQGLISQIVRGDVWRHLPVGKATESGKAASGERHRNASVTDEQVREIQRLYAAGGVTHQELAKRYGVSRMTVSRVVRLSTWRHVE